MTRKDPGLGRVLLISAGIHLAFYFIVVTFHLTPPRFREEPVYYVDMVNLPVAHPRAGSPSVSTGGPPSPPPPAPAPALQTPAMSLPTKTPPKTSAATPAPKGKQQPDAGKEFSERLARLESRVDASHQEAALDALRKKMSGSGAGSGTPGAPGMPRGTGNEAGSDYASYIQSRLRDAFKTTISYQSKHPEVVLRLTLDKNGRVTRRRIERSSGDRIFEEAVFNAIIRAEKNFPPPPDGKQFEHGFIFRPQGVGQQ